MKKNKASEYVMKKYNITSNLFINFLLLIKQFFYFFAYIIFFTFLIVTTTNAAFDAGETISRHLTPLNFLEQHRDLPVEYLYVIYMADIDLQHEFSKEKSHPLFSVLKAKKKLPLARKSILPSVTYTDLNDLMTPLEGAEYINNRRMFPLLQISLFSWLLKEYGPCYYQDKSGTTSLVTITINGMLYDIQRRAKNDPVAKLVLAFLNHPYVKNARSKSTDYQPWFIKYSPYLSQLFTPEHTEPTFSEKLALLTDSPYTEEQNKNNRLVELSKKGYKYKKDYNFISYELDENGKEKFVSSDEIILPATKSQKLLDDDYLVLSKPGDKSALKTGLKVATLLTAGLSLFPVANGYNTPASPPLQCNIQSKCPGNVYFLLNNANFPRLLPDFPSGCFELIENINLNQQYNLPFFKDCNNPFSGELKTGSYSIQTGNNISPIFGCINQTTITGNINLCAYNSTLTSPVIAAQTLHENILTIQQTGNCEAQYPLLGNITGDYNQITFTGTSGKVSTGSGTGIIASHVSGNHNSVRIQNSELYNTSVTTVAGGNNNTYHQQDLSITKFTNHKLPDNKLLAADFFTGNKTTIVQQNINASLIVSPPYFPHKNILENQNATVNTFSTDTFTQIDLAPETVRITNASDNSVQRSVMQNNGRFEIYRNNTWLPVCESTLYQKTAHAACKSLGYIEAKDEGARINLHERLNTTKLSSNPVHINRECTGYEYNLEQCRKTNTDTDACTQNREALLSCTNTPFVYKTDLPFRLTDHTSNDTYRFDTTNIGTGRLEYKSNNTYMTVCQHKFNAANANATCYQMGFNGGESVSLQQAPLNTANQLPLQWQCTNSEQNLTACSSSAFNPASFGCTHADDVILKCGRSGFSTDALVPVTFRLTDRHSNDASRAILTQTGFGRLEVLFRLPGSTRLRSNFKYLGFCSEDVLDRELQLICKAIGFDKGRKSHLTGKLLPVLNDDNRRNLFTCRNNNICMAYKAPLTGIYRFLTPCSNNVVIECTHSNSSALQLIPKVCSEIQERTTILFSGSYNYGADICHPDSCPLKYRDAHSSQLSGNLENSCQENSKTQSLNWLQLWEERCAATINYCNSCHLPYEEALDLVTDNEQQGETLLISRQSYSDRHQHNSIKPILINRLSPGNRPRIFHPKSHALKADVCAVNHILNERLLVGLYSTNNGRDSQLLWISLESENTKYHIKELSLDGRNLLLLTNNSIFAQDTNSTIIKQYSLNKTVNERNDNVRFNIDYSDYQEINLPQETDNILAASLKNDQLHLAITSIHGKTYLALTDGRNADDVYVMSYNISDKSWNCITEPVDGVTAKNIHDYSMVIDDDNQIQFLARESISIPKSGGCISLPIKIPAASKSFRSIRSLEDEQQLNNDTNSRQTLDNGQSSDNKIFAMLAAVPVGFVLGLFGGYILDCIRNRDHKSPDSSNEEEYKHSDNYHWNNSLKQKDPIDSHYYDKCKPTQNYRKSSNNTYYLVRGEEGQYAEYTVMPDKGGQGYVISKNKKQPSQGSSEQYYLVNNLTKEQENKKYFTLADTKGLLTSNSGTKQIRCTADTNKLPGHSISAAYDEITNDRYNQENTASYYTIDDKENRPVRLQVVDIHDVSQSSKVSSESTKSSAKQHNEVVYDIINAPGDDYSDTEETDHNKAYKNKRSIETTV